MELTNTNFLNNVIRLTVAHIERGTISNDINSCKYPRLIIKSTNINFDQTFYVEPRKLIVFAHISKG